MHLPNYAHAVNTFSRKGVQEVFHPCSPIDSSGTGHMSNNPRV